MKQAIRRLCSGLCWFLCNQDCWPLMSLPWLSLEMKCGVFLKYDSGEDWVEDLTTGLPLTYPGKILDKTKCYTCAHYNGSTCSFLLSVTCNGEYWRPQTCLNCGRPSGTTIKEREKNCYYFQRGWCSSDSRSNWKIDWRLSKSDVEAQTP